jgi:hypothetical protein
LRPSRYSTSSSPVAAESAVDTVRDGCDRSNGTDACDGIPAIATLSSDVSNAGDVGSSADPTDGIGVTANDPGMVVTEEPPSTPPSADDARLPATEDMMAWAARVPTAL